MGAKRRNNLKQGFALKLGYTPRINTSICLQERQDQASGTEPFNMFRTSGPNVNSELISRNVDPFKTKSNFLLLSFLPKRWYRRLKFHNTNQMLVQVEAK